MAQELQKSKIQVATLETEIEDLHRKLMNFEEQDQKGRESQNMKNEKLASLQRENNILQTHVDSRKWKIADQELWIDELEWELFQEWSKSDELWHEVNALKQNQEWNVTPTQVKEYPFIEPYSNLSKELKELRS